MFHSKNVFSMNCCAGDTVWGVYNTYFMEEGKKHKKHMICFFAKYFIKTKKDNIIYIYIYIRLSKK